LAALTLNSQLPTLNYLISLISRRINDVEQHREKEVANQNRERGVHYRFSGRAADADGAFARAQALLATDEYNQNAKTKRFRQGHDKVAIARPAHHVRHVIRAVDLEQKNCDEIAGSNADSDTFCHQQRPLYHHREHSAPD